MKTYQYIPSENVLRGEDEVIPCSGSEWEDRVYREDEFEMVGIATCRTCNVELPWQQVTFEETHCLCGTDVTHEKVAVLKAGICPHEPVIDTGVGYYHCPACDKGWSYNEWEAMEKGETDIWEEAYGKIMQHPMIEGRINVPPSSVLAALKSNYNITKK